MKKSFKAANMFIRYSFKSRVKVIFILFFLGVTFKADAQLTGFHSAYFQNEYLANPAMAGLEKGLNLNIGFQKQWNSIPGSPTLQNLTADYNSGGRVGLGLVINGDQAGLINRTRVMGTFAYHLPLSGGGDKLNFGLSFGLNDTYISYDKIIGEADDLQAENLNNRSIYLDGDFGISYTGKYLTIQGSLPNLKSVFFNTDGNYLGADRSTFFTSVSYKIPFHKSDAIFNLEPKFAFRGIKGFTNIFDAGVNLDLTSYHFSVSGIYHTNQTVTAGLGFNLQNTTILFAYSNNTGPVSGYENNTFELGLKLKFGKK